MNTRNAITVVGMSFFVSSCVGGSQWAMRDSTVGLASHMASTPPSGNTGSSPQGTAQSAGTSSSAAPASAEPGPPPWAPAHGKRRKDAFRYLYYETAQVYHDPERALYFSLNITTGEWSMSASLPVGISIEGESFVELDMDSDKPYVHHDEVRTKYPPGQAKKAKKEKKGKGKGPK